MGLISHFQFLISNFSFPISHFPWTHVFFSLSALVTAYEEGWLNEAGGRLARVGNRIRCPYCPYTTAQCDYYIYSHVRKEHTNSPYRWECPRLCNYGSNRWANVERHTAACKAPLDPALAVREAPEEPAPEEDDDDMSHHSYDEEEED